MSAVMMRVETRFMTLLLVGEKHSGTH
jgi:hypothetical protein